MCPTLLRGAPNSHPPVSPDIPGSVLLYLLFPPTEGPFLTSPLTDNLFTIQNASQTLALL